MPIRFIPDETRIPFMRLARIGFPLSLAAMAVSLVLFFAVGLNLGIDFKGGTLIEVQTKTAEADLGGIRQTLESLGLGDVEVQGFGTPNDVLIRIATQPGGDAAQQAAVTKVQQTLGAEDYTYRRVEVVGPRVAGDLAWTGTISVLTTMVGVLLYIWFRFEWQFAIGAIATLVHDVVLTIGFFAIVQLDFNLSSIAAILTIVGYSLNDTVVVFDRIREILRRYKQMSITEVIDVATNQTLSRTVLTSLTTLIALFALFFFGGEVIRSFTAAMIWGVFIGTYSSIFIGGPILIYFNLRPAAAQTPDSAPAKA
ncbi:protein translocase subunit SecF [Propylenella binzhouense]|uniref:Protein-export membrane protein SecF n=1 Tax=Propylenella binzhouense TaxID=2555902 RepID=A0A964WSX9_9HYPH|nr:protein translocase subunit SecF [Propylenella binzhouense]MYZ47361.1 protein translocase subunit SecF [Propylenella binzhouense]